MLSGFESTPGNNDIIILMAALLSIPCHCACNFPAVFNFGDSTSDTGAIHFAFPYHEATENPPYGQAYFGKPAYRYSDGRLSIDFFGMLLTIVSIFSAHIQVHKIISIIL